MFGAKGFGLGLGIIKNLGFQILCFGIRIAVSSIASWIQALRFDHDLGFSQKLLELLLGFNNQLWHPKHHAAPADLFFSLVFLRVAHPLVPRT